MICNKKLEALFDAALRALDEPSVKQSAISPMHHASPGPGIHSQTDEGMSSDEESRSQQEPISFAPAFWKTAL
jgi:hypothetical protein